MADDSCSQGGGKESGGQETVEKVEVTDGATYTGDMQGFTVKSGYTVTFDNVKFAGNENGNGNLIIEKGATVNSLSGEVIGQEQVRTTAQTWYLATTGSVENSGNIKKIQGLQVHINFTNHASGVIDEIAGISNYAQNRRTIGEGGFIPGNRFHNYGAINLISDFNQNVSDAAIINYDGAKIGNITGGTFKTFTNDGDIGDINPTNKAINITTLTNNKTIGVIGGDAKGVTISAFNNGTSGSIEEIKEGAKLLEFSNANGGAIGLISGGVIATDLGDTAYQRRKSTYTASNAGKIGEISGGTFGFATVATGNVAQMANRLNKASIFENADTGEIGKISGGVFETFSNKGKIGEISGGEFKINSYSTGMSGRWAKNTTIKPANAGTIDKISGGSFASLDNSGTISDITKASISTLDNSGKVTISGTLTSNVTNSGELNFAMKTADNLGQLKGDLTNNGGTINVDVKGATLEKQYTIITGAATGLDDTSFTLTSPNSQYLKATNSDDYKTITISKSQAFDELKGQLGQTKGNIADKLLTSGLSIGTTSAIADADNTIKESYISIPKHIVSNFKANSVNNTPLGQGLGASFAPTVSQSNYKPTASTDLLRFDNGYVVNSFVNEPQVEFFLSPFGGTLWGNEVDGSLVGVGLGVGYLSENYAIKGNFTYAYANSKQDLATQSTDTTAYMFQVGILGQLFFADLVEIDINANYLLGKFKLENTWLADSTLNSSSKFNDHQGNVGLAAGLRFGSAYSIKPFVGLQNYFESQGSYTILGFESEKYSDYALNGVVGVEGRAKVGDLSFLYARVSGELNFVNNQKELFMRDGDMELKYENESYKNTLHASLGAQIYARDNVKLGIEALYKYHDSGLNYFGGSANVRVGF